ncbi:pyridoxal phosphate-dependent aminotransferase [Halotalea alkalilenta]|uniref:pyridoxal phosphate-dependent aminotransferase n=1 Tax=Halotalea alkalilenta TaxID=376489 RepID=UPI00047F9FDD|nr:pyridoxal phosphate-dependent aminotransferase [Halotalea alkalilenta]
MNPESLLAPRMATLRQSPTAMVSALMRKRRAEGVDVIDLGEGELDFPSPEVAKRAGIDAIERDDTKYTAVTGTEALKRAVCAKFSRDNGIDTSPERVLVAVGGKQIVFNAMLATLSPGDEVLIPAPYWVSYPDIVALTGATARILPTSAEEGFKLTADALRAALTPRTRWLILNSPNNPSGAVYTRAELEALLEVFAEAPRTLLLADDIYEHLVFEGEFFTPAGLRPDLAERILTLNGVSKAYSMTGWRIGYATGPEWLIEAIGRLQSQSTTNPASMCQAAAQAALEAPLDFLPERLERLRRRRDLMVEGIRAIDGLDCATPQGAFYLYVDCAGLIGKRSPQGLRLENDQMVADHFAASAGVGVVPGTAFGLSPYLRLAYGQPSARLREALARLAECCARLD